MFRYTLGCFSWLAAAVVAFSLGSDALAIGKAPKEPAESVGTTLPNRPEELPPFDSLVFVPPTPYSTVLPNGITLYVLEDHELPIVNIDLLFGHGARCDSPGAPGVASYTARAMRSGGSVSVQGDALDDTLDFLAAAISSNVTVESGSANLNVMRKDFDVGLSLLADVVMNPAFPEDKIEEMKRVSRENIRRRDDAPRQIARMKFRQVVYGEDSPWSLQLEMEDIDRIARSQLVEFHRTWYVPNLTHMAVSGDIDREEAVRKITEAFAGWERAPVPEITLPEPGQGMEQGVYIYPKDVAQSVIRMGWLGMQRHSEDQYAVEVMNRIFGVGTSTSRLGLEVRSNRGLAYQVGGAVLSDPDPRQGMMLAVAGTRADKTHETVTVMRAVIDSMSTQPVTDAEMKQTKDMIVNSFIFAYDSPRQIVGQQMQLAYEGYEDDYLETYIARIGAVSKDDVLRVAGKYLRTESLRILVVGDSTKFDKPLGEFGTVRLLETYDAGRDASSP